MLIDRSAWIKIRDRFAPVQWGMFEDAIEAYEAAKETEICDGCEGLETELGEIIRVARENPRGLVEFLKMNFPKEWGLSKEEHRALLDSPATVQPDECRTAFEEWYVKGAYRQKRSFKVEDDGNYESYQTNDQWRAWQAAWNLRPSEREALGWLPIETAPKEGEWILAYWPTMSISMYPFVAFWDEGWQPARVADWDYGEVYPTLWQPCPASPKPEQSRRGTVDEPFPEPTSQQLAEHDDRLRQILADAAAKDIEGGN